MLNFPTGELKSDGITLTQGGMPCPPCLYVLMLGCPMGTKSLRLRRLPMLKHNLHKYNGHGGQGVPPCANVRLTAVYGMSSMIG